jgi:hypothetical protein
MKKENLFINPTNGFQKPTKYTDVNQLVSDMISNYFNSNKFKTSNKNTIFGDIVNTMNMNIGLYNSFNEAREATINHYIIKSNNI